MNEFPAVNDAVALLATLTPNPWVQAAIVVVAGLVLAKLAEWFLISIVARLTQQTASVVDDSIIRMLHKPVFTTFAVFGLMIASLQLSEELGAAALSATTALLQSIIILTWVVFLIRAASLILTGMGQQEQRYNFAQKDTVPLLRNLATVFLVLAGAYAILVSWNIDVTGLVASAGIVGLALSFAAQDTLSHLFAGVAILADRPYVMGDFIVLDTGERGQVTAIGLRSTRLMTRDDVEISIPNGVMGSAKIVNESGGGDTRYRIRAMVGAAYGSDVDHVLQVLESVARENPALCPEPEPRARFRSFGASSLDFELLAWIREPGERGLRVHELNCAIYKRFAREEIAIPFPQQDVYIRALPESAQSTAGDGPT
ncbi:MAG: mechanosensitive ion channel family protein [Gammaproteobacteria bacterium]|jgi:small-conductance mechanosensitive channel|nr:mechanosensitive ion channel family protein [Gammaproteobacteria bacterium]